MFTSDGASLVLWSKFRVLKLNYFKMQKFPIIFLITFYASIKLASSKAAFLFCCIAPPWVLEGLVKNALLKNRGSAPSRGLNPRRLDPWSSALPLELPTYQIAKSWAQPSLRSLTFKFYWLCFKFENSIFIFDNWISIFENAVFIFENAVFIFENLIFIGNQLNGKFLSIYSLFSILFRI